jgi:hypothetical protein
MQLFFFNCNFENFATEANLIKNFTIVTITINLDVETKKERGRERERETDRQTDRQTDGETGRQRDV